MLPALRFVVTVALVALSTTACTVPGYSFGGGGSGGADASTGGTSGAGGSGGTAGSGSGCHGDQDCSGTKPRCNTSTGQCVQCLPTDDTCPAGKYCAKASYSCQTGCKSNADCNAFDGGTGALGCDSKHRCSGCKTNGDCPLGTICNTTNTLCVAGCTATHGCANGQECCSGSCLDTSADVDNCGACGKKCPYDPTNSKPKCVAGKCGVTCDLGRTNCNSNLTDGCETCGACGGPVCTSSQTCQNGTCVSADAG